VARQIKTCLFVRKAALLSRHNPIKVRIIMSRAARLTEAVEDKMIKEELNEVLLTFGGRSKEQFGNIVISAGGAGSGKGFVLNNLVSIQGKTLDVDSFKTLAFKLPRLRKLVQQELGRNLDDMNLKDPADVSDLHFAMKAIGIEKKQMQALSTSILAADKTRKPNLIFDVTMKDIPALFEIIRAAATLGYNRNNVHLVWTVTSFDIAAANNAARKRSVSNDILKSTHAGVLATIKILLSDSVTLQRYLDGMVYFAFNRKIVDTLLVQSKSKVDPTVFPSKKSKGKYIAKAFYVLVKKRGKKATPLKDLDTQVMGKLKEIFPEDF